MKQTWQALAIATLPLSLGTAQSPELAPQIRTGDVDRFYALYDEAGSKPSAKQLQNYIDAGTEGFRTFAKLRNITGDRILLAMETRPDIFDEARKCAAVLPSAKARLGSALAQLKQLYPEASLPPVTIAVGRGKPVGTANENGVMIGLEALCATSFMNPDAEDRFVHVIAHEYVHVQQVRFSQEDSDEKVLKAALMEGGAEFVGELVSGGVSYKHLSGAVKGREKEIETAFLSDLDARALGSKWLYNHPGTAEWPADLGYWVGYRIAKAYYENAGDKRAALRDIIELRDPQAMLARSGWAPGM